MPNFAKLLTVSSSALLVTLSLSSQAFEATGQAQSSWSIENSCPSSLVNFWSSYARKHNETISIPAFLIQNGCINKSVPLDFFSAMQKRFDEPDQQQWREALEENTASL